MYQITMKADMAKSSAMHKIAAGPAKQLMKAVLDHAPSGAHVHLAASIPAGEYTVEMSDDHHGNVVLTLTPGVVP